jgi:hypothetical protein
MMRDRDNHLEIRHRIYESGYLVTAARYIRRLRARVVEQSHLAKNYFEGVNFRFRCYRTPEERVLDEGVTGVAMTWSEPIRETTLPRERAITLIQAGETLRCVW